MLRPQPKKPIRPPAKSVSTAGIEPDLEQRLSGSLNKGLAILEVLAMTQGALGVTELATLVGMTKSGVHRLLQVLCSAGWVSQGADNRYECTFRLWELAMRIGDRFDLRRVGQASMRVLAEATQESVHLSILDGAEILYVDKIDSPQPVRAYSMIGGRAPPYAVATGKAILAYCEPPALAAATRKLHAFTPCTLTTRAALMEELQQIRKVGYAINRGEWRSGVAGVGAPIFDRSGAVVGAIGISGPAERMTLQSMKQAAHKVVAAAQAISAGLGYKAEIRVKGAAGVAR